MHTTEHTDLDGDALAITRDKGLAWVTITRDDQELTIGPVPETALTEQPLGGYVRHEKPDASEPHPLSPEGVNIELAIKVARALGDLGHGWVPSHYMLDALTLALSPEPQRPDGAEEMEALLGSWGRSELLGQNLSADDLNSLADHLAERGVRVVTEDGGKR